jgi:hypothetical protein
LLLAWDLGIHKGAEHSIRGNDLEIRMKKPFSHILLMFPAFVLFALAGAFIQETAFAQNTTAQSSAKVTQYLKQGGYTYRQAGDNVWVIKMEGNVLKNYEALVATNEGVVVIGVVMANKKDFNPANDLYFKLLKLNHERDFMKIGFDNDDDLFVRTEQKVRNLDLGEFQALIEQVKSATDLLYTEIKPSLKK